MFLRKQSSLPVLVYILAIMSLIVFSSSASAQSEIVKSRQKSILDSVKIHSIDEVTIYGRKSEIVPAQVLSGEELRKLSVLSVADALRYFSGVQIKDYGGIGGLKTVNVRSMGSQHVGVFFDGIQIGNAQNGTVDLGKFSLDNMEAVSLYNGQKSEVLQSAKDYTSASSIYMVTRKPRFEQGRKNNITLKGKTGSFDLLNASALWETKLSDKVSLSTNAEYMYTSGKYKFRYSKANGYDTTEIRRNGDMRFLRAEAALFGKFDGGEWQTKAYFYNSERGYPGAAVKNDYGISLQNEDRQADRNFFVQSLYRKNISALYSFKIQAKYANDYMNYIMPQQTTTLKPEDIKFWQQELYLTAANLFTITENWSANLACDLQYNNLDAREYTQPQGDFNLKFVKPRRYTVLGAAATSLRLGSVRLQGSVLYTFVTEHSARGMDIAPNKSVFTPTIIASYRPFAQTDFELRAFYKKIFRMPTFNDLYYVHLGERMLKPEYTTQYNLGFIYNKNFGNGILTNIGIKVDAYYNQVTDKIIATPTSNQLIWTMINLGYVEIKGIDVGVIPSFKFGNVAVNLRLNYTYQKAQDMTPEEDINTDSSDHPIDVAGNQIPYTPVHGGSAIISATYRTWDLNYSFIYTGERYMLGANIPVNYIMPWYTHDVSVTKTVKLPRHTLKITAEVNDIFNQHYEVVKWYPMPGTNFRINLTYIL